MRGDPHRLLAVTGARDRLRTTACGGIRPAKQISFSEDWLHEFEALRDEHLFCPTTSKATGHSFWGVPLLIDNSLGPNAVVRFDDASEVNVHLGVVDNV